MKQHLIVRAFHGTLAAKPFSEFRLPKWKDREHSIFAAMSPSLAAQNALPRKHGERLERLVAEVDIILETERLIHLDWNTDE